MPDALSKTSLTKTQRHAILMQVHPDKWRTTRWLTDATPWSVLTVIMILRLLEADGLVESRRPAQHVEWKLTPRETDD